MGSHTGESYLVDYTQRTSGTCLVTQVKYIFWITPGTCLVRSTTIEFRGPSGANDWKPFDLQDLTPSRCYEYLPFELIIGVIGWCSRGAFLLTCKRNGFNVQFQIWLFFNFDNTTRLRHMWSGPPMSPSPMSPCGAKAQTWGLSSSKPNRWLLEVWGSSFQVGLDVILRPGPFNDAERDFGGLPYWLLKWVRLFWLHNCSLREGEGKLRTSDPKFLDRVRSWYTTLFSRYMCHPCII